MAIPSTGPLSGTNINDEFPDSEDGGLPMQLSEYRGLTVSKNGQVFTIPQSPSPISYSDFQGVIYAYEIEIWVVGGGGGGSSVVPGGGGGAGRLETGKFLLTPGTSHNIVVGNGGNPGFSGNQSRFGSLITALGGTAGTNDKGGRSNFLGSESSVDTEGGGGGDSVDCSGESLGRVVSSSGVIATSTSTYIGSAVGYVSSLGGSVASALC